MDYKEKLRLAKEALESGSYDKETIEYIFPELKESEDERIRKELIKEINGLWENDSATWPSSLEKKNKYIAWLERQAQKPAAWSEEDERYMNTTIAYLKDATEFKKNAENCIDWLKSLKDRTLPQPKQEWSKEDEEHIDSLLKRLDALCRNKFERTRFAISEDRDWLESLRPQNKWKPSDEHIHWLKWVINRMLDTEKANEAEAVLEELLEQLKKLREE